MVLEKGSVHLQKSAILYHAIFHCIVMQKRWYIDTTKVRIITSLVLGYYVSTCIYQWFALLQSMRQLVFNFSHHLLDRWKKNISEADQQCIERFIFASKGTLTSYLKLWWYPPEAPLTSAGVPDPQMYHTKQLFLWMPRKMWRIDFRCPQCATPQYLRYWLIVF